MANPKYIGSQNSISVPKSEFLPDSRVGHIRERLDKEITKIGLPDDTSFATSIDPGKWVYNQAGLAIEIGDRVVFWAVAPNPQPRWIGKHIKEVAYMDLSDWSKAEDAKWRFAGAPDLAYNIFRSLVRRLAKTYKDWEQMN